MKRYRITVDGRTYEVEIDDPRARPVTARVLGEIFRVEVESETPRAAAPAGDPAPPATLAAPAAAAPPAAPAAGAGQQALTAPIPGTIAKVSVGAGQIVQRGDELLTIEAMKMFNVIRSPWAGTVAAVQVREGQHVAQAQPLLTIAVS
ncbi:MAG: biotin/lipoyl-binding protein [Acidobacteria bacterium]|nr:biotin/lipoyl-binding protein [Acidobacteriota bacterium]